MKSLIVLAAMFSFAIANAAPVSGAQAKKLDNVLKKLVGNGISGETTEGKKCEVTYESVDVMYRHKPTGETYMELLIKSPDSAYQDCGVAGINFTIDKSDLAGKGNIGRIEIGKSEITAGASNTFDNGERGPETFSRRLKIELNGARAKSVQLQVMGTCNCIMGR